LTKEVSNGLQLGHVSLTNYKLFFRPNGASKSEYGRYNFPYGLIKDIKDGTSGGGVSGTVIIETKDERSIKFKFDSNPLNYLDFIRFLRKYALQLRIDTFFCMHWQSETMISHQEL